MEKIFKNRPIRNKNVETAEDLKKIVTTVIVGCPIREFDRFNGITHIYIIYHSKEENKSHLDVMSE
jgi:hypothetical protein